jgi:hypothetical protein
MSFMPDTALLFADHQLTETDEIGPYAWVNPDEDHKATSRDGSVSIAIFDFANPTPARGTGAKIFSITQRRAVLRLADGSSRNGSLCKYDAL